MINPLVNIRAAIAAIENDECDCDVNRLVAFCFDWRVTKDKFGREVWKQWFQEYKTAPDYCWNINAILKDCFQWYRPHKRPLRVDWLECTAQFAEAIYDPESPSNMKYVWREKEKSTTANRAVLLAYFRMKESYYA